MMRMNPVHGNQMIQYGLLIAMLALFGVSAMTLAGNNISAMYTENDPLAQTDKLFSLLDPKKTSGAGGGNSSQVNGYEDPLLQNTSDSGVISSNISSAIGSTLPGYTLGSGSATTSSQGIIDMTRSLGTSATTKSLLASLNQMVEDAIAEGKLTPEQAESIHKLSAQGNRLAKVEAIIEETVEHAEATGQDVNDLQIDFEGNIYSLDEFRMKLGWTKSVTDLFGGEGTGKELEAFQQRFKEAQALGSLDDPDLEKQITGFAKEIILLSESVEHISAMYTGHVPFPPDHQGLNDLAASELTSLNANHICQASQANNDCGIL